MKGEVDLDEVADGGLEVERPRIVSKDIGEGRPQCFAERVDDREEVRLMLVKFGLFSTIGDRLRVSFKSTLEF